MTCFLLILTRSRLLLKGSINPFTKAIISYYFFLHLSRFLCRFRTGVPATVEFMTLGGFVFWARWPVPVSKWSNDVIKIHERPLFKSVKQEGKRGVFFQCFSRRLSLNMSSRQPVWTSLTSRWQQQQHHRWHKTNRLDQSLLFLFSFNQIEHGKQHQFLISTQ